MNCPKCNREMEILDVLTNRTTSPEEDDTFEKMWVCLICDEKLPFFTPEEEDNDDD